MKTIKYGGIRITKIGSKDPLVPTRSLKIKLQDDDRQALAVAIKANKACLLIGETGTGKTSAVKELAHLLKQPYVRINMTGFTTPDELIGSKSVKDGKTYFEYGIITDAMQRGAILVIDEINATTPDCLFILHGLLDEDRQVTLPNGEVIKPHQDFRVFATCNPEYEGTKSMNRAFKDRFPIILEVNVLPPADEVNLILARSKVTSDFANKMVTIATMIRKEYMDHKIATFCSTRGLLEWADLIKQGLDQKTAFITSIVRKASDKNEQKVLVDFYLSVFKQAGGEDGQDVPVITTQGEIDETKKLLVESHTRIVADRRQLNSQITELALRSNKIAYRDKRIELLKETIELLKEKFKNATRK